MSKLDEQNIQELFRYVRDLTDRVNHACTLAAAIAGLLVNLGLTTEKEISDWTAYALAKLDQKDAQFTEEEPR